MTLDEIEDECLANNHAVRIMVIEDRSYAVVCSECRRKIEMSEPTCRCGLCQDNYSGPSIRYEIAMVAEQSAEKELG